MNNMIIQFENLATKDEIQYQLRKIKEKIAFLEEINWNEKMELNEANIKKAKKIVEFYNYFIANWEIQRIRIELANSDGTKFANIIN